MTRPSAWDNEIAITITCISRMNGRPAPLFEEDPYQKYDLIDGSLVFKGVDISTVKLPLMLPNDFIDDIQVEQLEPVQGQSPRFKVTISANHCTYTGDVHEAPMAFEATSVGLVAQEKPSLPSVDFVTCSAQDLRDALRSAIKVAMLPPMSFVQIGIFMSLLVDALVAKRNMGHLALNKENIRHYSNLTHFMTLSQDASLSPDITTPMGLYLSTLPGWDDNAKCQSEKTLEYHGFARMHLARGLRAI